VLLLRLIALLLVCSLFVGSARCYRSCLYLTLFFNNRYHQLSALVDYCKSNNLHLPKLIQNEFHPLIKIDQRLKNLCDSNGIAFQAHSSLGCGSPLLLENATVLSIAEKYSTTAADVLFKYGLANGCKLIVKSISTERIANNMKDIRDDAKQLQGVDVAALTAIPQVSLESFDLPERTNGHNTTLLSWLKEFDPAHYDPT